MSERPTGINVICNQQECGRVICVAPEQVVKARIVAGKQALVAAEVVQPPDCEREFCGEGFWNRSTNDQSAIEWLEANLSLERLQHDQPDVLQFPR